jgi:hypothetical protein
MKKKVKAMEEKLRLKIDALVVERWPYLHRLGRLDQAQDYCRPAQYVSNGGAP